MDPLLAFDVESAKRRCVEFIRRCLADAGLQKVVLGLSGGVDSAVVAVLCAEAAGRDNIIALLMPYKTSSPSAIEDAEELARLFGIKTETLDITP
ncbi:MAG: NAD(+) synthase, partial [Planctomycetota bacterium]